MSSDVKIPEWAFEVVDNMRVSREAIARALLAAEQRGLEKAADRLPDEIDLYQALKRAGLRKRSDIARFIAAAIRSLGEKT